jgi:sulfide dehydrogenase cytochrome subunit
MKRNIFRTLCLGTLVVSVAPQTQAEDLTVNRLLASQCAQCHGTNGHSVGDIDDLTDESYKDLYEDLMDMRSEDRPEDIMDHQALGYTDDQVRRIALYFGTLSGKADEAPEFEDRRSR